MVLPARRKSGIRQTRPFALFCDGEQECFVRQRTTFFAENHVYFFFYDYWVEMYASFFSPNLAEKITTLSSFNQKNFIEKFSQFNHGWDVVVFY